MMNTNSCRMPSQTDNERLSSPHLEFLEIDGHTVNVARLRRRKRKQRMKKNLSTEALAGIFDAAPSLSFLVGCGGSRGLGC